MPSTDTVVQLSLPRNHVGQILDGLEVLRAIGLAPLVPQDPLDWLLLSGNRLLVSGVLLALVAAWPVPVEELVSEEYAAERRELIEMDQVLSSPPHGSPRSSTAMSSEMRERLDEGDTIYLTVADSSGMMVSLIQSNYAGMGSGLVPDGLGFMLQDRGALFSLEKGHPNVYEPGKRPFHTIIPAFIMKDGEPFMSFGVMGGGMQPQGHVQIVTNMIDFGMNLQEAGDAARWRHTGSSQPTDNAGDYLEDTGTLSLESGVPYSVIRGLMSRGHDVQYDVGGYGGYQAIMFKDGVYYGASESRKDGHAEGY